jgi:murein DD-endopeptidase MepM/ murein hydrolase activator NlpD
LRRRTGTRAAGAAVALALLAVAGIGLARATGLLGGLVTAPAIVVPGTPLLTVADTLHAGETISQVFERHNITGVDWPALAGAVGAFEPSRLRAGMAVSFIQRGDAEPESVATRLSRDARLVFTRVADRWDATVEPIPWRVEPMLVTGSVSHDVTSVYDAVDASVADSLLPAGERDQLVWALADVYDWEIDFARDLRPGDDFRVLAQRLVAPDGEARFGRIMAARIDLSGRRLYAFRYDLGDKPEFYDETGHSLRRQFLHNPLRFKRISSRFSRSRWQPILHYFRPHLGTDYAADLGTPVRSVGAGVVVFAGREGDYGNLIEVRHPKGIETLYGHLDHFAPGIRVGVRVAQGQEIGYVGSTGLSTGPHLHFEVREHGRAVNPLRALGGATPGAPIAAARRAGFEREMARLLGLLEPAPAAIASSGRS